MIRILFVILLIVSSSAYASGIDLTVKNKVQTIAHKVLGSRAQQEKMLKNEVAELKEQLLLMRDALQKNRGNKKNIKNKKNKRLSKIDKAMAKHSGNAKRKKSKSLKKLSRKADRLAIKLQKLKKKLNNNETIGAVKLAVNQAEVIEHRSARKAKKMSPTIQFARKLKPISDFKKAE